MSVDMTWLETYALKGVMSDDEKEALASLEEVAFCKGERILTMGDAGGVLYIIKSGQASVQDYNRYEGRLAFLTLQEGDFIGEISFLNGRRTSADVIADEDCILYMLQRETMLQLMADQPKLALQMMNAIVNHEAKMLLHMRRELVPMLRKFSNQSSKMPLAMKVIPIAFTLAYAVAFFMIGYKY